MAERRKPKVAFVGLQEERQHIVRLMPGPSGTVPALRELAQSRDLVRFLIWRDILVRYKQTAFGIAWAVLQPLGLMVVFAVFLGRLAKVPSDGQPYAVFVYSGLVLWTFFSQSFLAASRSLVDQAHLISKVYFQRLVLPIAAVGSHMIELAISFVLLLVLLPLYGIGYRWTILLAPMFAGIAIVSALAVGVLFAAVNVRWRDVAQSLPFLSQIWMFATPVVYPASLVPERWRPLYGLNPMVGAVEGFRWALIGGEAPDGTLLGVSSGIAIVLLAIGVKRFIRLEATFSDVI